MFLNFYVIKASFLNKKLKTSLARSLTGQCILLHVNNFTKKTHSDLMTSKCNITQCNHHCPVIVIIKMLKFEKVLGNGQSSRQHRLSIFRCSERFPAFSGRRNVLALI
jgi:hypothetical protein